MDVRFTEEQNLLRESARALLERECSMEFVRSLVDDESADSEALWAKAVGLGWTGLACGERYGGAGLGLLELSVLMEETGRVLMPGPLFSTVAIGAVAISLAGTEAQRQRFLPPLVAGNLRVALAQLEASASWGPEGIAAKADPIPAGFSLTGEKLFVADAATADLFIVPVLVEGGHALLLVPADSQGVRVQPVAYTDQTRRMATVRFEGVEVAADNLLGGVGEGWNLLQRTLDRGKVALSAQMCGGAARALEISVEYAKTREQFGSPIGKFQSIQHKCADMFVLLESSRSATYYAAWAIDNEEPDAHRAACLAKAYCSDAFSTVAAESIQIHGGFGFTWEADCHLFYKRAKADALCFGDAASNRSEAVTELVSGSTFNT